MSLVCEFVWSRFPLSHEWGAVREHVSGCVVGSEWGLPDVFVVSGPHCGFHPTAMAKVGKRTLAASELGLVCEQRGRVARVAVEDWMLFRLVLAHINAGSHRYLLAPHVDRPYKWSMLIMDIYGVWLHGRSISVNSGDSGGSGDSGCLLVPPGLSDFRDCWVRMPSELTIFTFHTGARHLRERGVKICLDAGRLLANHPMSEGVMGQTGLGIEMQLHVIHSPAMPVILLELRDLLIKQRLPCLGIHCESGERESVALAELLASVLHLDRPLLAIEDLQLTGVSRQGVMDGDCQQWQELQSRFHVLWEGRLPDHTAPPEMEPMTIPR